jgi:hypothetical protein
VQFHAQEKLFCWRLSLESNKRTLLLVLSICVWYGLGVGITESLVRMMKHFGGYNMI